MKPRRTNRLLALGLCLLLGVLPLNGMVLAAELPEEQVVQQTAEETKPVQIVQTIAPLSDSTANQTIALGGAPVLPTEMICIVDSKESTHVPVTWKCDSFDAEKPGEYTFTAKLPEGYSLADNITLPAITVIVEADAAPFKLRSAVNAPQTAQNPNARAAEVVLTVAFHDNGGTGGTSLDDNEMKTAVDSAAQDAKNAGVDLTKVTRLKLTGSAVQITNYNWAYLQQLYTVRNGHGLDKLKILDLSAMSDLKNVESTEIKPVPDSKITEVIFPDNLETIGKVAFRHCAFLESVAFPKTNSLKTLGFNAFSECKSLTSITLPEGLETVEDFVFSECTELTSVTLPKSLQALGEQVFIGCEKLEKIEVASRNQKFVSVEDVLYSKDLRTLYCYPAAKADTAFSVPGEVKEIAASAFRVCKNLRSVSLPDGLETMGAGAFVDCTSIASVTLPASLKRIGLSVFMGCESLTEILVAAGNESFKSADGVLYSADMQTFYCCPAKKQVVSFTVPQSVRYIDDAAFWGCTQLTDLELSVYLEELRNFAFMNCANLTSLTLPANLKSLGESMFVGCTNLTSLTFLGDTVPDYIGVSLSLSDNGGVLYHPERADYSKVTSKLPPSWTVQTFQNVLTVTFDSNGTGGASIDDNEMKAAVEAALTQRGVDKTKITTIALTGSATEITGWNWKYLLELYRNSSDWTALTTLDLWGISGLTKVENGASSSFGYITKLTAVRFPDSIQTIGRYAFCDCVNLKSVTLPESLTTIGEGAFSSCSDLTSVSLPGKLTTIGYKAFLGCIGLTSMSLPESLTTIGDEAFDICSGLTAFTVDPKNQKFASKDGVLYDKDIQTLLQYPIAKSGTSFTIPDTVQTIGNGAFARCTGLTSVSLPESLTTIGDRAFYDCYDLTNVTFPKSLTTIGKQAFYECLDLTNVTLPEKLITIGEEAFAYCDRLKSMTFQCETPPSLGSSAFQGDFANGTLYHPANAADAYASGRFGSPFLDGWTRVPLYALTVNGGSDERGGSLYLEGAQVQISAGAAPTGKIFDRWTGGDDSIFASGSRTDASTTITMPAANVTVTASFRQMEAPGITGEVSKNVTYGYAATSSEAFTITGSPVPTVELDKDYGGKLTWNASEKKLEIAAGLGVGAYPVKLTVENSVDPKAEVTFTLVVEGIAPVIASQPQDASYTAGQGAASLKVTAQAKDDGTLAYQWYQNTADSNTGGTKIAEATRESYTPDTDSVGTVYYYCTVTSTYGGGIPPLSTVSDVAAVLVTIPGHEVISGPEGGKPLDLTKDAVFGFAGEYAHLAAIRLNGHTLTQTPTSGTQADLSGYPGYAPALGNAKSGSVMVTLYKDFLQTLPGGTYKLETEFLDGGVTSVGSTAFEIRREKPTPAPSDNPTPAPSTPSDVPATGDESTLWSWVLLATAALIGFAALLPGRKGSYKKRHG